MTPDWINGDPAELRHWRATRPEALAPTLPEDVAITELGPLGACRGGLLFTPAVTTEPDIVHFHGGSFMVGSPETHRIIAAWLAHLARARVFSVRYRLAPEHPVPAQAEDAAAAIRRFAGPVRLAGDSAGAMVALWGHAALTAAEGDKVTGALLIYGGFGIHRPAGPDDAALEADGLGPRSLAAMYARLDPHGLVHGNPALDPMHEGFPLPGRLCLIGATDDPLLRDTEALAERARSAGLSPKLILAKGEHGFLSALPAPDALNPLRTAVAWLDRT